MPKRTNGKVTIFEKQYIDRDEERVWGRIVR